MREELVMTEDDLLEYKEKARESKITGIPTFALLKTDYQIRRSNLDHHQQQKIEKIPNSNSQVDDTNSIEVSTLNEPLVISPPSSASDVSQLTDNGGQEEFNEIESTATATAFKDVFDRDSSELSLFDLLDME